MSSASASFGKFKNNLWANMGSKFFIHTSNNLTIGTDAGPSDGLTKGAGAGSNLMTRVDASRAYRDVGWRNNAVDWLQFLNV